LDAITLGQILDRNIMHGAKLIRCKLLIASS
jgi:hypothetical protein